jgi:hypothetical protein
MDAMLSRFRSAYAMNNREELDGFLAALICSPDIAKPSVEGWKQGSPQNERHIAKQSGSQQKFRMPGAVPGCSRF